MNELKKLWDEMCEQCGSSSEFIDSKPNLIIVVPRYIRLLFWKIKKDIDDLRSLSQPRPLSEADKKRRLAEFNDTEDWVI